MAEDVFTYRLINHWGELQIGDIVLNRGSWLHKGDAVWFMYRVIDTEQRLLQSCSPAGKAPVKHWPSDLYKREKMGVFYGPGMGII